MIIATILTALVAIEHLYILVLEMFLWETGRARAIFGTTKAEVAMPVTKLLAANQGLYNGFLAVGLLIGILLGDSQAGLYFKLYFLACVIVAAIYGGATVSRRILFVQGIPALLAIIAVLLT